MKLSNWISTAENGEFFYKRNLVSSEKVDENGLTESENL